MTDTPVSREEVYVALKDVFQGEEAKIRKIVVITRHVAANAHRPEVGALIQKHGIGIVCQTASVLLQKRILESISKAQERFPNTFKTAPIQITGSVVSVPATPNNDNVTAQLPCDGHQKEPKQPAVESTRNETGRNLPTYDELDTDRPNRYTRTLRSIKS